MNENEQMSKTQMRITRGSAKDCIKLEMGFLFWWFVLKPTNQSWRKRKKERKRNSF
jgi:hypothetical protein